jgi:hypothetical protein
MNVYLLLDKVTNLTNHLAHNPRDMRSYTSSLRLVVLSSRSILPTSRFRCSRVCICNIIHLVNISYYLQRMAVQYAIVVHRLMYVLVCFIKIRISAL